MKREDYRYGNLVQDREGSLCVVEGVQKDGVQAFAVSGPITKLPCEPIPIAEEWFLRFGFELFPWGWVKGKFLITMGFVLQVGNGLSIKIENVHQLQNLYFALTGEELTLKK